MFNETCYNNDIMPNKTSICFKGIIFSVSIITLSLQMKAELERLQKFRKEHLGTVLKQLKNKLDHMWDKCHVGELTRTKLGTLLGKFY